MPPHETMRAHIFRKMFHEACHLAVARLLGFEPARMELLPTVAAFGEMRLTHIEFDGNTLEGLPLAHVALVGAVGEMIEFEERQSPDQIMKWMSLDDRRIVTGVYACLPRAEQAVLSYSEWVQIRIDEVIEMLETHRTAVDAAFDHLASFLDQRRGPLESPLPSIFVPNIDPSMAAS